MSNRSAKKALGWGLLVLAATVVVEAARITRVIWQPSLDAGIMRVKRVIDGVLYVPVALVFGQDPHGIFMGPSELKDTLDDRCSGLFTGHIWPVNNFAGSDMPTVVFTDDEMAKLKQMIAENC